jgi:hypothetical protein
MKPRPNEKIGGGYFVFRRGKKTGRISVRTSVLPFEHPTFAAAMEEAHRLAEKHVGETFEVFNRIALVQVGGEADADLAKHEAMIVSRHDACPDGGSCHHGCEAGNCFRVGFCGPLTGVFEGDQWPPDVCFDEDSHLQHLDAMAQASLKKSGKEEAQ